MSYIKIKLIVTGNKTSQWGVYTADEKIVLGAVRWHGAWKGYAFVTGGSAVMLFEQKCLREIADFVENETKKHREQKKKPAD